MNKLTIIGGFDSNSASPTDIIYGKLTLDSKNYDIICKVFLENYRYKNKIIKNKNSLLLNHEVDIYKYLRDKVIQPYMIRNILYMIDSRMTSFDDYMSFIKKSSSNRSSELSKLSKNQLMRNVITNTKYMIDSSSKTRNKINYKSNSLNINDSEYMIQGIDIRNSNLKMIITPKIVGNSLAQYIQQNPNMTPNEFMRYMSIIFITLHSMAIKGINQNDLHWGNILMAEKYYGMFKESKYQLKDYFLIYENTLFLIDNKYTPVVYDFDRASVKGKRINELNWGEEWGNCPKFHPKRDILKMLCCMYWEIILNKFDKKNESFKTILRELMDTILKSDNLRNAIKKEGIYEDQLASSCWLRGSPSFLCLDKYLDEDIVDTDKIINWCLKWSNYEHVNLTNTSFNNNDILKLAKKFKKQIGENNDPRFLYSNTQFVKYGKNKFLNIPKKLEINFFNEMEKIIFPKTTRKKP